MYGETWFEREITKEQYDRACENGGYPIKEDVDKILTEAERLGYGASCYRVFEKDGKVFVRCHRYNNCD